MMCCILLVSINISIITVIHIQIQSDSVVQVWTHLLTSDFSSSTWGKRHNSYYANPVPTSCVWCLRSQFISAGRDPKTLNTAVENSTICLHGPMSTFNWCFFKILKFSEPSLPGMMSSTPSPISCLGVYYDNGDSHILCTQA